jgi:2-polyprenyl-6-methoxyphenol hydroxylase-like FAD-dependent oxidoreductase
MIKDNGDTMLVTFADGTTTLANLVIGADGIHSAVRGHYVVCLEKQKIGRRITLTYVLARHCPIWRDGGLSWPL